MSALFRQALRTLKLSGATLTSIISLMSTLGQVRQQNPHQYQRVVICPDNAESW